MKPKPNIREISLFQLCRGAYQPRRQFGEEELAELAASIKTAGLIQPLVVRPLTNDRYEIVAGERRWRAAQLAGLETVPCLINHYSDEEAAAVAAIENINRVDLNPIEEAQAYQRMIEEFGYLHEELAAVLGKSRTAITNGLRLLKLAPKLQEWLISGELSQGHGKILAGFSSAEQFILAEKCIQQGWNVRKLEKESRKLMQKPAAIKKDNPNLQALEKALGDHVGCKVTIDYDDHGCRLNIDCHNLEILEGVLGKLGFKNK